MNHFIFFIVIAILHLNAPASAIVQDNLGNYDLAIDNYLKSLRIKEDIKDKNGIAGSFNNIGAVYHLQGQKTKTNNQKL